MGAGDLPPTERELRIGKRLQARREERLFDALLALRGVEMGERFRLRRLLAVGGEGAIFTVSDQKDPEARLVGKVALQPWHKPIRLTSKLLKERRGILSREAALIRDAGSPFLPEFRELTLFRNPLLDPARAGAFAEPEPCLVMERLPGQDLDLWLCRVHRGGINRRALRPTLDRITVGLLQALADLEQRGYLFADLRPGNLRVVGRPERRVRLLDAGSCVQQGTNGGRFPHVPAYLPPSLLRAVERGEPLVATPEIQAVMAGRTLYEVATGEIPHAGSTVDMVKLFKAPVSPDVIEVIAALGNGDCASCAAALSLLSTGDTPGSDVS